ncbi:MAG TPA: hypothetical protein VN962_04200 [Polyangia bacterium]|nr:hypothetical protein [Polyangia bacterium]
MRRRAGGQGMRVAAACLAGALAASCSSDPAPPPPTPFAQADCRGQLVEVARFPSTDSPAPNAGTSNHLATDGATLFLAYSNSRNDALVMTGLPSDGGVVAIPLSGAPTRVVAAADVPEWQPGSFWVAGGQVVVQTGTELAAVPADAATPGTVSAPAPDNRSAAYAHDAEFGYYAGPSGGTGVSVVKIPIGGGSPTALVYDLPGVTVGGMADAGDALLLQVRWQRDPDESPFFRVWRVPKDGSPQTEVRIDVRWADAARYPRLLVAWDGQDILGPVTFDQGNVVVARVAPDGTSAPIPTRLAGSMVTRRGDEILSLQLVYGSGDPSPLLVVASSQGDSAGTVLACGGEPAPFQTGAVGIPGPLGIAATDDDVYVAYTDGVDLVIARVAP